MEGLRLVERTDFPVSGAMSALRCDDGSGLGVTGAADRFGETGIGPVALAGARRSGPLDLSSCARRIALMLMSSG